MAVSTIATPITYDADGVQTDFVIPWSFEANEHVRCTLVDPDGVVTEPSHGAGLTVVGDVEAGFAARFSTAPADGSKVTLYRAQAPLQTTPFNDQGRFPAARVAEMGDRLARAIQDVKVTAEGGFRFSPADHGKVSPLAPLDLSTREILAIEPDPENPGSYRLGTYFAGNSLDQLADITDEIASVAAIRTQVLTLAVPSVLDDIALIAVQETIDAITATGAADNIAAMAAIKADLDLGPSSLIANAITSAQNAAVSAGTASTAASNAVAAGALAQAWATNDRDVFPDNGNFPGAQSARINAEDALSYANSAGASSAIVEFYNIGAHAGDAAAAAARPTAPLGAWYLDTSQSPPQMRFVTGTGPLTFGKNPVDVNSVAGRVGDVTLTKTDVGLANVDNTADADKPVSTATQSALNGKVPYAELASTANGEGASLVGVEDAADNFTATNLEGVLAELANVSVSLGYLTEADAGVVVDDFSAGNYTAMANLLAQSASTGKKIVLGPGGWPLPHTTLNTAPIYMEAHPEAVFKANVIPDATNDGVLRLGANCAGSVWQGGVIDGDRDVTMNTPLTGAWTASGTTMNGVGGNAAVQLAPGDFVRFNNHSREVASVTDANTFAVDEAWPSGSVPASSALTYNRYLSNAGVLCVDGEDIKIHGLTIKNAPEYGLLLLKKCEVDALRVLDSGGMLRADGLTGSEIDGLIIRNAVGENIFHNGKEFNRHVAILWRVANFSAEITARGIGGNDDNFFCSGITTTLCRDGRLINPTLTGFFSDCQEVGISVGGDRIIVQEPQVIGIAGTALETKSAFDTIINGGYLDGKWRSSKQRAREDAKGITNHELSYYDDTNRRPIVMPNITINGTVVRRFGDGLALKGKGTRCFGVQSLSNIKDGFLFERSTTLSSNAYDDEADTQPTAMLESCVGKFNGGHGFNNLSGRNVIAHGCEFEDNAQNYANHGYTVGTSNPADRSNAQINHSASTNVTGDDNEISNSLMRDTQGWTVTDALTFDNSSPASVTVYNGDGSSSMLVYHYTVSRRAMAAEAIFPGQNITVKDAKGNGSDLVGWVYDVFHDEIVVESQTGGALAPGTNVRTALAGAGNWSASGTALTCSSGGNAIAAIPGPTWIKHPTLNEYRLAIGNNGDNSITLASAFSSGFSGQTPEYVAADAVSTKTVLHCLDVRGTTGFKFFCKDNITTGAIDGPMNFQSSAIIAAGSEFVRFWNVDTGDLASGDILLENNLRDGSRLTGYRMLNGAAWNNASSMDLLYTNNAGGSTLATIKTGLDMTAAASNIKAVNNVVNDDGQVSPDVRLRFAGTAPTTGDAYVELLYVNTQPEGF